MKYSENFDMDTYNYGHDRLRDLWHQIGTLHLSYLEMEESPQKLKQRNILEDHIQEFLCLAPHNQKFIFRETADVLHRSASTKKDFSGYKAILGWNAIAMYAANLVTQPWRKEYKQIQLYSGFYKHQIDSNLVGAEVIFEVMGYKHDGDGILAFEGPICPDRVISISQDCLIAYVECQILKAIWEEVSQNYKTTWLDILEFRETHLCNPKQSIQALNYRLQEHQFHQHTRSYSQGTDSFTSGPRYTNNTHASSTLSTNHSFPPLHSHSSIASIPLAPQCIYGTNGYYPNNFATYAPVVSQHYPYHVPFTYTQSLVKPMYHPANCFPNGYTVPPPPPPYACQTIPTGQLIEVDTATPHHYDTVDSPNGSPLNRSHALESYKLKNIDKGISEKEDVQSDTMGSWDYVYRNLESQGYSKDLGERGDLLSPSLESRKQKILAKEVKKSRLSGLENSVSSMHLNDKQKATEIIPKYSKDRIRHNSDVSKSNDFESKLCETESNGTRHVAKQLPNGVVKSNTLLLRDKSSVTPANNSVLNSKTLDLRKLKPMRDERLKVKEKLQSTKEDGSSPNKWQCSTCTFLNNPSQDICEMCFKSKTKVQDIMAIGGSECPKCTLVNPKDNKTCDACRESLENSPTYI
ncbi:hypothetical protein RI129_002476 [Pyrocoelia pectoralis]|uniref:RanBP2-type domain-containing protein n=1 Tax=Pyrocoelia pectoralis TaxID=417401 RepID=A0AAN7VPP0_9COLE